MTNKQRAKIYREAAEIVFIGKETGFCCDAIEIAARIQIGSLSPEKFPEFYMFNFKCDGAFYWWKNLEDGKMDILPRTIALLLSEQMALNPPTK